MLHALRRPALRPSRVLAATLVHFCLRRREVRDAAQAQTQHRHSRGGAGPSFDLHIQDGNESREHQVRVEEGLQVAPYWGQFWYVTFEILNFMGLWRL